MTRYIKVSILVLYTSILLFNSFANGRTTRATSILEDDWDNHKNRNDYNFPVSSVKNFKLNTHQDESDIKNNIQYPYGRKIAINFELFETNFAMKLRVNEKLLANDAMTSWNCKEGPCSRPARQVSYIGTANGGSRIIATLYEKDKIHMRFHHMGKIYVIEPLLNNNDKNKIKRLFIEEDTTMFGYSLSDKYPELGLITSKNAISFDSTNKNKLLDINLERQQNHKKNYDKRRKLSKMSEQLYSCPQYDPNAPYDLMNNCPTSLHEIEIGYAADTGFLKTVSGFGSDSNIDQDTAIELVEAKIQEMAAIINIMFVDTTNVFLRISAFEIRSEVDGVEAWNDEPLDQTNHETYGAHREEYGCAVSRNRTDNGDYGDTLQNFRSWVASGEKSEGLWHLLTNCYPPPGTVGLAYMGVTCDFGWNIGWSSWTATDGWYTIAHELGHNFDAAHAFDTGTIMSYDVYPELQFSDENEEQICTHINTKLGSCYSEIETLCGNEILEPGEECDDSTSCCSDCKFVQECSPGNSADCCTSECFYEATHTQCTVCGGSDSGYCFNGMCRYNQFANDFGNIGSCVPYESEPCILYGDYEFAGTCIPAAAFNLEEYYIQEGALCNTTSRRLACDGSGSCSLEFDSDDEIVSLNNGNKLNFQLGIIFFASLFYQILN